MMQGIIDKTVMKAKDCINRYKEIWFIYTEIYVIINFGRKFQRAFLIIIMPRHHASPLVNLSHLLHH